MIGQTEIPVQPYRLAPPLPDELIGSAVSRYSDHKVQRRDHCSVCIWLLHHHRQSFMPRTALYQRTAQNAGHELEEFAYLCPQHRTEWRERDNPVRIKAGKNPW
jgi:hypothetical protein